MPPLTSRQEWGGMWPLVLSAMLGLSGAGIFAYSSGIFMEGVTATFGWTRAEFSGAFVLQMALGTFIGPAVGRLIDRIGPRRTALLGIVPFAISIALLGLASGSIWQWWLLCGLIAFGQGMIAQTVWVAAIVSRFKAARGLAMAITLSGLSLANLIWPPLAAFYIQTFGWRAAYPALAVTWLVVVLPLVAAFFFGARDHARTKPKTVRLPYLSQLKTPTFIGLIIAGGYFSSSYYGFIMHLVPMLRGNGISLGMAASMAGLAGLCAIVGRLTAGYLLDRFPTRPIGVIAFLLPVAASILLLSSNGSIVLAIGSVIFAGLAAGAEMDIITFIVARRFGEEIFGSVYSIFVVAISLCASTGPLIAGAIFDTTHSYDGFLLAVMGMVGLGALIIACIPLGPADVQDSQSEGGSPLLSS